ncbi:threonine-phosphate decarboxylase CobD [Cupriavidus campinensis]|uniref:threonine-phosphate decarboxylase n=1 Tax=Cupriavidus campinensis TaxID=151783 RepID=A0AAE9I013_9BURK|nr:threonine-phosphate decarboxylase CobD [Cupriavidus campinensis]TSP12350.1 threonine-phosphate decarboxylase [Cupriavidus campinensis]URF03472.1 threonine-phosphate decarboxylase CobD [Cupriavidus campinensis]
MSALAPIRHGGNLLAAARRYGRPVAEWLDLSTGINPDGYPVPPLPAEVWQRLPQDDDALADIAARAYGGAHALPVAGSQAAIRTLPRLLRPGRVGIAALGYSEYAPAFALAGHTVVPLDEADFARVDLADDLDHLVVVNPNNPTARLLPAQTLRHWHRQVARRHGTLVVDEAFMDALAAPSLVADAAAPGLVVLRSLGKFYGLAGVRCGFVFAAPDLLAALGDQLGHWTVSGPARAVAQHALADTDWQHATRARLAAAGQRLAMLLREHGLSPVSQPLFSWIPDARAPALHAALAQQGVWTRLFDAAGGCPASLRLGLPPDDEPCWRRLDRALADATSSLAP